jgi:cell division protein FtsW (lipid II flippase)
LFHLTERVRYEPHLKLVASSNNIIPHRVSTIVWMVGVWSLSAMNKPRRTKIALAVATVLIGILVVMLVVLLTFDWNRAKPWLNARTSELLGRPFAINGESLTDLGKARCGMAVRAG